MENDYELLYLAGEDKELIEEILYKKYKPLIYSKIIKYSSSNQFAEDYLNIAKLSLSETIDNYQDKYKFITYLNTCLDRSLSNYHKEINRNKHKILNESLSINNEELNLFELQDNKFNPERIVIEEANHQELRNKIINKLTWQEELIFTLKEQYYTNKEISEITDKKLKTVYNIVNRIKNKVSNIVSNE